jgi:hypothetical protein
MSAVEKTEGWTRMRRRWAVLSAIFRSRDGSRAVRRRERVASDVRAKAACRTFRAAVSSGVLADKQSRGSSVRLVTRLLGLVRPCRGVCKPRLRGRLPMATRHVYWPLATPTVSRNDIHPSSINLQLFNNLTRQRPQASSVPPARVCDPDSDRPRIGKCRGSSHCQSEPVRCAPEARVTPARNEWWPGRR